MRTGGSCLAVLLGLVCVLTTQLGEVCGAVRMGTHGIRLHHEWEKSVGSNEWDDWALSFANSDVSGDGRIRLSEVANVYRDHFNHIYHNEMDHKTKSRHLAAERSHFEEEARDFIKFVTTQRKADAAMEGDSPVAGRRRRRALHEATKPIHQSKNRKEFINRRARQLMETHEAAEEGDSMPYFHDHKKEQEQTISFPEFKTAMHKYMTSKAGDRRSLLDMAKHIF